MNAFSSLTHTPQPQLALDSIDVLRQLEACVSQWPSDLQQSFLQIAKYLTGIVVSPVGGLPLAGGHPHLRKWESIIPAMLCSPSHAIVGSETPADTREASRELWLLEKGFPE
jgi:hypothetical protein